MYVCVYMHICIYAYTPHLERFPKPVQCYSVSLKPNKWLSKIFARFSETYMPLVACKTHSYVYVCMYMCMYVATFSKRCNLLVAYKAHLVCICVCMYYMRAYMCCLAPAKLLYTYVCVYVSMYAFMNLCMYVYVPILTRKVCAWVYEYTHLCMYVHAARSLRRDICVCVLHMHGRVAMLLLACAGTTCMCICMHLHTTCVYIHTLAYVCLGVIRHSKFNSQTL
jgi:hypothetical protein